ncbi:glycerol-3-phosphate acyltransferase [Xylariaceae sp. FL0804]|nr:glycerol-3-phosphate acyltransferase [Xylariaceae sp. FL0804]
MPSYFYHLKLELYPTYPLEAARETGRRTETIWLPAPHSSIFENLPSHPRRRSKYPSSLRQRQNTEPREEQNEAAPPHVDSGVIDCGAPRPPETRDARDFVVRSERALRQRTLSFPPPRPPVTLSPERALKDWRFGQISEQETVSIDIDVDGYGDEDGMSPAATSSAGAAAVGPSMTGAGKAARATYVPLATAKNTNIGWGIVHLYREEEASPELFTSLQAEPDQEEEGRQPDCTTVCIPAVPSYLSPSDFLGFMGEKWRDQVSHYRMVMTGRLNRYLVLMKFRDGKMAKLFRREFDGRVFNVMEPETCNVAFIKSVTFTTATLSNGSFPDLSHDPFTPASASTYGSLKPFPPPTPNLIELPTCPVCLERMDDTTGLLTIPCQHVFHCSCLQKWKGSGCPVCRHTNPSTHGTIPHSSSSSPITTYDTENPLTQPFGSGVSNLCSICDCADDLWICLICGNVGCGRYKGGHAKEHWKDTAHTFALELDTQHVWDYAGDMWVHRLIRDKGDGKLVELPGHQGGPPGLSGREEDDDVVPRAKLDNIGMEYTHLLTSQLESQRIYFEEMLSKAADKAAKAAAAAELASTQASAALAELGGLREEQDRLRRETVPSLERDLERERARAAKSTELARGLGRSLQEERRVSEGLMGRIEHVNREVVGGLERELAALRAENADLRDQVHDLGMFVSGRQRLQELEDEGAVADGEIREGSANVPPAPEDDGTAGGSGTMADAPNPADGVRASTAPAPKLDKELYPMTPWKYDAFLHTFSVLVDLFFREVHPRGAWRVPKKGPILFVAAPHANQFVDGLVLQRTLKQEANRRVGLLIAEKSVHGFIGWGSRQTGSVPVGRAQDKAKPAKGLIYLPDPVNDPTLIRGVGTDFEKEAEVAGMIFLPSVKGQSGSSVDIAKIVGPEELRTKRPFKGRVAIQQLTGRDDVDDKGELENKQLTGPKDGYQGTKYKIAPHIDQTDVYKAVFTRLRRGGCVGIFPEGGSHDRTALLPLKAGVAIMALGALAEDPDCELQIVPVGMNYFHAHKFRSRAVIEFGAPFQIPRDLVDKYRNNERRDAIGQTLDMVHQALSAVTVSAPDYDTLMCIQAARRLYNTGRKMPLPMVVELNRRLAVGFSKFNDDPRIVDLMDNLRDYNKQLRYLNIKDHQVSYARLTVPTVVVTLLYRLAKLLVLSIGVVPGTFLFAPVFVVTKYISLKKAKEALAGSSVKVQGRDVIATWKLLVAMAFAPALYNLYSITLAFKVYQDDLWGYMPHWVPFWAVYVVAWIIFPAITFAAFRIGEVGMDILKSLRPLILCISPTSSYSIQRLRERRAQLSEQVVRVINDLGPDMYEDFEKTRLVADPLRDDGFLSSTDHETTAAAESSLSSQPTSPTSPTTMTAEGRVAFARQNTTQSSRAIPRNESFSNIGAIGMFATRPPSPSNNGGTVGAGFGGGLGGFTTLDSPEGLAEANGKIRSAMRRRGLLRRRRSGLSATTDDGEADADSDAE